jgi:protein transport protein SEC61 subunit gamma-like protein
MSLREFIQESQRVFRITKKPSKLEYTTVVKVAGLGILFIGFIGFLLHLLGYAIKQIGF